MTNTNVPASETEHHLIFRVSDTDIVESAGATDDLAAERRFEIAANAASLGVWHWDLGTDRFYYSPRAREICGFSADEPLTLAQITATTHPDDLSWTHPLAERAIDPNIRENAVYRYRIVRADTGEVRWVLAHGEASFEEHDGSVRATSYIGTLQDITEQKRSEDALVESEARLRLAIEAGNMAVWELDPVARTITQSPQLNLIYGFPAEAPLTIDDLRSRYAPGEEERLEREGAEARARGETQIQTEFKQIWPDGTIKWLLLRAQLAPTARPGAERVIGVLLDITDRKLAEERMSLVVREMQHRVKNSLAVVQTLATQSFRADYEPSEALSSFLGRVRALAAATSSMTDNSWEDTSLVALADHIVAPYRGQSDPISLLGPDVPLPRKLASAIAMALHELCTNAVKYGALSVDFGRVEVDWQVTGTTLFLTWREIGGPTVEPPTRKGFGTRLLKGGLLTGEDGNIELDFLPGGLVCQIEARLD
jgi:PAS domain S-box-containing protein